VFHSILNIINQELSGERAHRLVTRISQWHRIQASPMYREAATWVYQTLQSWGLDATLESYPTREGLWAWGEPLFQEWSCEEGWLELPLADGGALRLADYAAVPLSLMPRSASADGEFELVVVEGGDRPEDYEGLDVRGKLVLTRSMPMSVHHIAVQRLGAAGIVFDGMRAIAGICPPGDLPDAIQYASWWWWGGEARAFGFALSQRAGGELRRHAARAQRLGVPLRLRARVRSSFRDGAIEAVSALIPGASEEEVLLVAHLCHPAPCANDNASGAAAAMEIARGLRSLVAEGRLPQPRRSIRVLWIPEMTGAYLYLAHHEDRIGRTVAGLNLDMVGADQTQTGSVNVVVHTSDALPSYVGDLLEALREQTHGAAHSFHGRSEPPLYRYGSTPFSNGSDHYVLGDSSVGIPTPMIIEWPDRFYHTTADTLEKVSPATLQRNMRLAATYIWAVADAGPREAGWIAREVSARFSARLARELQSAVTAALGGAMPRSLPWASRLAFRVERHQQALASLRRLDPSFDPEPLSRAASAQAELLWQGAADVLEHWQASERPAIAPADAGLVPRRRYRGPLSLRPHLARLPAAERDALLEAHAPYRQLDGLSADIALAWANGERTLGAILDLVELETDGRNPEALVAHFKLLARLGLIDLI
jgi:aminopeptidase YwaD